MTEQLKLRILEIANSGTIGSSEMGPISTTICTLANGFDRLGHSVTVCDTTALGTRCNLNPRIRVVTVPLEKKWPRLFDHLPAKVQEIHAWLSVAIFLWFLHRRVKLSAFDVVHVHDYRFACLLALLAPNRFYYTSHDSVWALMRDQGEKWSARGRWEALLERFAIRKSRATIALGDYLARQAPDGRLETIPHGIDPQNWQPLDRETARAALGISSAEFIVVFVGRIHPQKGVDVLIDAIRHIASDLPRLRVVVIGSPGGHYGAERRPSAYARAVMGRAQGAPVEFVGFLSNQSERLRQYLSACEVVAIPSRHEPFGYVALEALAMSVPVIASRTGGLSQTVSGDVGLLVPPGDVAALAAAIRTLCADPARLRRLRERCRARVVESYGRDESVRRHLALFTRISHAADVGMARARSSSCPTD